MGRSEHYNTNGEGTEIHRYEIEGEELVITEKMKTTPWRKKDWPTRVIRWKGVHRFQWGDIDKLVGESVICDAGPLGISASSSPPDYSTEEERAANRAEVCRRIGAIFGCKCYWNDEGGTAHVGEVTKEAPPAV